MIRYLLGIFLLVIVSRLHAQPDSLGYYRNKASQAYEAGDQDEFYKNIKKAERIHPTHPTVKFWSARASALKGKSDEAIELLTELLYQRTNINLDHADFASIRDSENFKKLFLLQKELSQVIINSDTAFLLDDPALHIECIAAGESKNIFYLGSINKRKIIRVENGKSADFTKSGQDGICSVLGIKVDTKKGILWACSSPMEPMQDYDTTLMSAVYKYELKTGRLLKIYRPTEKSKHVFGDLILDSSGKVYVSDSQNNIVFTVNEKNGTLDNYYYSKEFWNIQGIAFDDGDKRLYIADYIKGIYVLDTKTRSLKKVTEQFPLSTKSVDGMIYWKKSLITLQNSIYPMRATRYILSNDGEQLTGYKIIDRAHPAYPEPTIGCVSGDKYYYVANSSWEMYDAKFQMIPEKMRKPVVLRWAMTLKAER
jgi:sugar lactone lactonase YvrE